MLVINRIYQPDCTIGMLTIKDEQFRCFTLELPYKDNRKNISSIPPGLYRAHKHISPKFGKCISIQGVLGRSHILIHPGNYTHQIKGCILVGRSITDINEDGIPDVSHSVSTLETLMNQLSDEFLVQIN